MDYSTSSGLWATSQTNKPTYPLPYSPSYNSVQLSPQTQESAYPIAGLTSTASPIQSAQPVADAGKESAYDEADDIDTEEPEQTSQKDKVDVNSGFPPEYPLKDDNGYYYLYGLPRDHVPVVPKGHTVIERNRPPVPQTEDHERRAARWEGGDDQDAREVKGGMNSGKGWLGYFSKENPEIPVTKCRFKGVGRVSGANQDYPLGNVDLPAGLSLEQILNEYPNHVWGPLLRVFVAEGWTATAIYEALPWVKADKVRGQNYLQKAVGRQQDEMLLEDGIHRKMAFAPGKAKKQPAQMKKQSAKSNKRKLEEEEVSSITEPPKKRQYRKTAIPRTRLSVQQSQAVKNLVRDPIRSRPYPSNEQELETQEKIESATRSVKLAMARDASQKNGEMAKLPLVEHMQKVEKDFLVAFNDHVERDYLRDDDMKAPLMEARMDPFDIMLTIAEYSLKQVNPDIGDDEMRKSAYGFLGRFLKELTKRYDSTNIARSPNMSAYHTPGSKQLLPNTAPHQVPGAGYTASPAALRVGGKGQYQRGGHPGQMQRLAPTSFGAQSLPGEGPQQRSAYFHKAVSGGAHYGAQDYPTPPMQYSQARVNTYSSYAAPHHELRIQAVQTQEIVPSQPFFNPSPDRPFENGWKDPSLASFTSDSIFDSRNMVEAGSPKSGSGNKDLDTFSVAPYTQASAAYTDPNSAWYAPHLDQWN